MESYGIRSTKQMGNSQNHMGGLKLLATNFYPHYSKAFNFSRQLQFVTKESWFRMILESSFCYIPLLHYLRYLFHTSKSISDLLRQQHLLQIPLHDINYHCIPKFTQRLHNKNDKTSVLDKETDMVYNSVMSTKLIHLHTVGSNPWLMAVEFHYHGMFLTEFYVVVQSQHM